MTKQQYIYKHFDGTSKHNDLLISRLHTHTDTTHAFDEQYRCAYAAQSSNTFSIREKGRFFLPFYPATVGSN